MKSAIGIIIGICVLASVSCAGSQAKQKEPLITQQGFYQDYEENLRRFHREIDTSLELRKGSLAFYTQETLEGKNQYFNAHDLSRIQFGVEAYAKNRKVLLEEIAYRYRAVIEEMDLVLTTDKPTHMAIAQFTLPFESRGTLYINPTDEQGIRYIRIIKMGLAAALTLYDNFIIAIMPYQENGHFRRSINYDNIDNQKLIEEISGNFRDLDNYKDTLRVVEFNDLLQAWTSAHPDSRIATDKDSAYFDVLIDGSYTNRRIKEVTVHEQLSFRTVRFRRLLRDFLFNAGNETLNLASKAFGNSVGLIATREGYLKNIPNNHKEKIKQALQPGDILLEKTPFRLTDRFIPGHWGHVAIWVGNEQQLRELGVWDELPALYEKAQKRFNYQGPSFQSQIKNGHMIVEALRPGVQINTLEHFLNVDDMAVLRSKRASTPALKRYVLRAFAQVGKEYDFNFDVETDTRIVCSELAFVTYDNYQWPVDKTAGRYTISPDHIGEKAQGNGPFEVVMLYHDGNLVSQNIQQNFNHLMMAQYHAVRNDLVPIKN
ncbi:MAG: hypothetical protein MI754_11425 [Chromatiales bacterium]|nr:hypothetical protein [Chromatiales bacterium]